MSRTIAAILTLPLMLLAGCTCVPLSDFRVANRSIGYISWDSQPNRISLKPGMELHVLQTTQRKIGSNDSAPALAEENWRIPAPGEASRSDWLRLHNLLVGSWPLEGTATIKLDDIFASVDPATIDYGNPPRPFDQIVEEKILQPVLDSMIVQYDRVISVPQEPQSAGLVRQYLCQGQIDDFGTKVAGNPPATIPRRAQSQVTFEVSMKDGSKAMRQYPFGDDWYYRSDLQSLSTAGSPSRPVPSDWYDPAKDVLSVRSLVQVRIALRTSAAANVEMAAPCLSVRDFEQRTGSEVIAIRRLSAFAPNDDGIGKKPEGSDGRVAIAFKSITSLLGASGYFKVFPDLKQTMLLAHGDVLVVKRPPTRSGYRLD